MGSIRGREFSSEAIVLRVWTLGEDDLGVDFLSPDQGRLFGVARHGRRSHKRFGGLLDPLRIVHLRWREGVRSLFLEEASPGMVLDRLGEDLGRLMTAFHLVDLIRTTLPERDAEPEIYSLLRGALIALQEGLPPLEVLKGFEARFLELSGWAPDLGKCLSCGRPREEGGAFWFVFSEGGVVCSGCGPASGELLTETSLPDLLARFVEYHIGRPLKSRKLLTEMVLLES